MGVGVTGSEGKMRPSAGSSGTEEDQCRRERELDLRLCV